MTPSEQPSPIEQTPVPQSAVQSVSPDEKAFINLIAQGDFHENPETLKGVPEELRTARVLLHLIDQGFGRQILAFGLHEKLNEADMTRVRAHLALSGTLDLHELAGEQGSVFDVD